MLSKESRRLLSFGLSFDSNVAGLCVTLVLLRTFYRLINYRYELELVLVILSIRTNTNPVHSFFTRSLNTFVMFSMTSFHCVSPSSSFNSRACCWLYSGTKWFVFLVFCYLWNIEYRIMALIVECHSVPHTHQPYKRFQFSLNQMPPLTINHDKILFHILIALEQTPGNKLHSRPNQANLVIFFFITSLLTTKI